MKNDYCLLLGVEKNRFRSILASARSTSMSIAIMQPQGFIHGNRYAELVLSGNPENPEDALMAVKHFEQKTGRKPGAVIPMTEMVIASGASIAQAYGLPYLSASCLSKVRNKYNMRKAAQATKINIPQFEKFSTKEELMKILENFPLPAVIKPTNAGGSEGVCLIHTQKEAHEAFQYLQKATDAYQEKYGLSNNDYQIEEYIASKLEVSVEVLNTTKRQEVLAVTDKKLTPRPYFVEIGHSMPSIASNNELLKAAAIQACKTMEVEHGVAHVEFLITENDKIVLLEVNARTPGGGIPELFEKLTGVNMFELHCRSYLYDDVDIPNYEMKGFAAIGFMKAPPSGKVVCITLPKAKDLPDAVFGIQLWTYEGKKVNPCYSNGELEGFIEFFWPDKGCNSAPDYMKLTKDLTKKIISVG